MGAMTDRRGLKLGPVIVLFIALPGWPLSSSALDFAQAAVCRDLIQAGPDATEQAWSWVLIEECAQTLALDRCGEAWAGLAGAGQDRRWYNVVESCVPAYCDELAGLALCEPIGRLEAAGRAERFADFHVAASALDFGLPTDAVPDSWRTYSLAFALGVFESEGAVESPEHPGVVVAIPLPDAEAAASPPPEPLLVAITTTTYGAFIRVTDPDGARARTFATVDELSTWISGAELATEAAVISADHDTDYTFMVSVMDALLNAGISELALELSE